MDLVGGGSVADLLAAHGPLPLPFAAALVEQLLSALAALHERAPARCPVWPGTPGTT
jgi:serine/threonine-protein kinase